MKSTIMRSSSAAYRSIRQYEALHGKTGATVEKIGDKQYLRMVKTKETTFAEFVEKTPNFVINGESYKYFPDGASGEGFYELKTGNRRRPNSKFISLVDAYIAYQEKK